LARNRAYLRGHQRAQVIISAHTRYEYPTNGVQSKVYSTIIDTTGNGADTADEVLTESWADGAGRIRQARVPHTFNTNGATATWAGTLTEYDILGRVKRASVPTEVDSNFNPTGDDLARGWLWTSQEYDWKSRVTRTINTDGTDTLAEYEGCGCAGGEILTLRGEQLTEGRRTQKIYSDVLGRETKRELFDWNGSVYKTATNAYNGRDQVHSSRVYAGTEYATEFRETTFTFDGHGRLTSQHEPQQDANTATVYTYFPDDKPATITDARGAAKHYSYNNLGLIDEISWTAPQNSNIAVPGTATFNYDNAGNRTEMSDGFGIVTYVHDQMSHLTSETRQFNETVSQSPTNDNKFKIEYTYDLSGKLASYKEPFGEIVSYGYDKTGKIKTVSGNRTVGNTQVSYVTDADYRAWGAVKAINFGNNLSMTLNFNTRQQAQQYDFGGTRLQYGYFNDGKLKSSDTDYNFTGSSYESWPQFDRSYEYDFLGRLTAAKTGAEAHGQTETNGGYDRPYRVTLEYNKFGDVVSQQRLHWLLDTSATFQYQNDRMVSEHRLQDLPGWDYVNKTTTHSFDADGRPTDNGEKYDAAGKLRSFNKNDNTAQYNKLVELSADGNGHTIKTRDLAIFWCVSGTYQQCQTYANTTYRIVSSVIGDTVAEIQSYVGSGLLGNNFANYGREILIYANEEEIAKRRVGYVGTQYQSDDWLVKSTDPSGVEHTEHLSNNNIGQVTTDPFGAGIGLENPYPGPETVPDPGNPDGCDYDFDHDGGDECTYPGEYQDPASEESEAGSVGGNTCYIDGVEQPNCNQAEHLKDTFHDDAPVTKEDEFPDVAPSDSGPQGIHQNDDPSDDDNQSGDAGEQEFEADTTRSGVARMRGDLDVEVSGPDSNSIIGVASDWDFRSETMPHPEPTPPRPVPQPAPTPALTDNQKKDCEKAKQDVIKSAKKQVGSTEWAYAVQNGNFEANTNKCNQFVNDVLSMVGVQPPQSRGWGAYIGAGGPPQVRDWADKSTTRLGKWEVVTGSPQPGDVISKAIPYSDATGHMGIVVENNTTVSAAHYKVLQNNWGFRQSVEDKNPVLRRLNCHFF
jgi:YD repeat-containing protein